MRIRHSIFLLTLLAASTQAFGQTVVDGNFENSVIGTGYDYAPTGTDWTYTFPSGLCNGASPWHDMAENGNQYGFIQSGSGVAGGISSSITGLTSGQSYVLDFFLGTRGGYVIDPLEVQVGGVTIATNVAPADLQTGTGWTEFDFAFTATASSASVAFLGADPAGGDLNTAIDNVSVQAVPEPAPFAILGLGALGLLRRRRLAHRG